MTTPAAQPLPAPRRDAPFLLFIGALSLAVLAFIAYLLLGRSQHSVEAQSPDFRFLPTLNAGLNAVATVLLISGYIAIRKGARRLHPYLMVGAFAASLLFLAGYLTYHAMYGDTKFQGTGAFRIFYFTVLISHIALSTAVMPLALTTLYFAARRRWQTHRKVARVALPIWLYVSITGIAIYFMLHGLNG